MYHLLIIVVALLAVVRGYRRGLTGQVTSVLGLAFGVICTHIFIPGVSDLIGSVIGRSHLEEGGEYLAGNLAALLIYGCVYMLFRSITGIVRHAARMLGTSLLDSLMGAAFCIFNYLLVLSMILNVLVGYNPGSSLMRDGRSDDGNLVSLVLCIAPATLGSEDFSDFAHRMQLRDARKISCAGDAVINHRAARDVISVAAQPVGDEKKAESSAC